MKKTTLIIVIVTIIMIMVSPAYAKRSVDSNDYESAGAFLADIEKGTKVSYDAYIFNTEYYVDEDSFCLAYVLLPWSGIKYSAKVCFYAKQEDLGDINADALADNPKTYYARITGIAENKSKNDCVYVYINDGQGSIELIDPEQTIYKPSEIDDIEEFSNTAINYLDLIDITGTVIDTDDKDEKPIHHFVYVSCGNNIIVRFSTNEKEYFIDDEITGIGLYTQTDENNIIYVKDTNITLIN